MDTNKQLDLFKDLDSLITDKFTAYHEQNPSTYQTLNLKRLDTQGFLQEVYFK